METADHRLLRRAFVAAAVVWALALPLAALAAKSAVTATAVRAPAALAYAIGALVCHQQTARSFALAGVQLPVCARCTGIYAGAAVAAALFLGSRRRKRHPPDLSRARIVLLASAVPIALTLVFEWTTGITPSNLVRALSGLPVGAAVAFVCLRSTGDWDRGLPTTTGD